MAWIRRLLVLLLVLAAGLGVLAGVYVQRTMPVTQGDLRVQGLRAPITISRDAHGIPTVQAQHDEDAVFGLGFVHAQDRLWQMATHQRIAAGRLAEAFGPTALEQDRFIRALGIRRAAQAQWENTRGEVRELLEAYSAGVNAFLSDHLRARPPEFLVLRIQPEPWTPVDTLSWMLMMAWDLGGNWTSEVLRMRLAASLPLERIESLLPPYPGEQPLPVADYGALYRDLGLQSDAVTQALTQLAAGAPPSGVEGVGSNNWVVAGSHTASGRPLLANDTHLRLTTPSLWYAARLMSPGLHVAGATIPGLPFIVLGQNRHVAWGFTNTGPDVQDLYLEQIDPADPERYRTPEGWERFERFEEVIRVRGEPDVRMTTRRTRHGPVISDAAHASLRGLGGNGYALALRWSALEADNTTLAAALAFNRATDVASFVEATRLYHAPMQNIVMADAQGRIGFVAAGRVPERRPDNDLQGLVPAPGWMARYDWAGYLDPLATPREFNPVRGWIATANHRIHGPDYPHFLTSEWHLPYRAQRIELLLAEKRQHSVESLRAIQSDVVSLAARSLLPALRSARPTHALGAQALALLRDFDGTMSAHGAAPLIYAAWARSLTRAVFADDVGEALYDSLGGNRDFRAGLEGVLARNDASWCDDRRTDLLETCQMQIDSAMDTALTELVLLYGDDLSQWRWGDAHVARSQHRPFSRVSWLAPWFEVRVPSGGDTYTVNTGRYSTRGSAAYVNEHAATLRAIYDLGDPSNSGIMHTTGQSGLVFSEHYRSFARRWMEAGLVSLWAGGSAAPSVLTLQPVR